MRRRSAWGLMAAGCLAVVCAVALPTAAVAADSTEVGSGFGSYNLQANAPVEQVRFNDGDKCAGSPGGTGGCEGVVPETVSTLRNGPIAYALSAVAWPGVLAGNVGSVIVVSNGPSQANALNDPVRAEARNGSGPDTVTNTQYPGLTMAATAKDTVVKSSAEIAQSSNSQAGTFNKTVSNTKVELTGPTTATAEAYSHAQDISLAGGVVTIGSVTSTASGTTNGLLASAAGKTVVNDVKIAGVPVTIDQNGVTVNGNNAALNKAATDAVNTAIQQAGMSIAISLPSGKPDHGSIVYNAGSLVFAWNTPGGSLTAILGGATVQLAAVQGGGFGLNLGGLPPFKPSVSSPAVSSAGAPTLGGAAVPGSAPGAAVAAPVTAGATGVTGSPGTIAPALAANGVPLPGPASPVYAILGLAGVGLLAAGMRQLPDRVLEARATACLLGEQP